MDERTPQASSRLKTIAVVLSCLSIASILLLFYESRARHRQTARDRGLLAHAVAYAELVVSPPEKAAKGSFSKADYKSFLSFLDLAPTSLRARIKPVSQPIAPTWRCAVIYENLATDGEETDWLVALETRDRTKSYVVYRDGSRKKVRLVELKRLVENSHVATYTFQDR